MRHAAVSISSNIAEGSSRSSDKEFAHFLEIAYGSLMEVVPQSQVAYRQAILTKEDVETLYKEADELARMLSGFKAKLKK